MLHEIEKKLMEKVYDNNKRKYNDNNGNKNGIGSKSRFKNIIEFVYV